MQRSASPRCSSLVSALSRRDEATEENPPGRLSTSRPKNAWKTKGDPADALSRAPGDAHSDRLDKSPADSVRRGRPLPRRVGDCPGRHGGLARLGQRQHQHALEGSRRDSRGKATTLTGLYRTGCMILRCHHRPDTSRTRASDDTENGTLDLMLGVTVHDKGGALVMRPKTRRVAGRSKTRGRPDESSKYGKRCGRRHLGTLRPSRPRAAASIHGTLDHRASAAAPGDRRRSQSVVIRRAERHPPGDGAGAVVAPSVACRKPVGRRSSRREQQRPR